MISQSCSDALNGSHITLSCVASALVPERIQSPPCRKLASAAEACISTSCPSWCHTWTLGSIKTQVQWFPCVVVTLYNTPVMQVWSHLDLEADPATGASILIHYHSHVRRRLAVYAAVAHVNAAERHGRNLVERQRLNAHRHMYQGTCIRAHARSGYKGSTGNRAGIISCLHEYAGVLCLQALIFISEKREAGVQLQTWRSMWSASHSGQLSVIITVTVRAFGSWLHLPCKRIMISLRYQSYISQTSGA